MENKDLIRKSLDIINESLNFEAEEWNRSKAKKDSDHEVDEVSHDNEADEDEDFAPWDGTTRSHAIEDDDDTDDTVEDEADESTETSAQKKESAPKKEAAPKAAKTPKSPNKSKVDWASHSFPGMGEGIYEDEELNEGVNITLDGPEADEFVARLMQLSGQPVPAIQHNDPVSNLPVAQIPLDIDPAAPDMDGPVATGMDEPIGQDFDQPLPADHFVDADETCIDCERNPCECDMGVQTSGPLLGATMEENADHDHGHYETDDEGIEIDPETYMWKAVQAPQRMVKGTMGDNPLVNEETMERYNKIVDSYIRYLNEGDTSNEDGQASPLTADSRTEFKKDPHASDTPKDDGSMSPMSQIDRQDVMK